MDRRLLRWTRNLVLAVVAAAFVLVFGQPQPGPTLEPVADIDGEPVLREVFDFFREQNEALLRDAAENADARELQGFLDRQTLEALVHRQILAREARALGLWVAAPEVHGRIVANPSFSPGGRFDSEVFERFVVQSGLASPRIYTDEVRRDLLVQKFQRAVSSPVRVSTPAARETAQRERARMRLRFVMARPEDFRPADLAKREVEAFAEVNAERIRREYERRLPEFVKPEEVRARHILFTGEQSRARAAGALERIRAGEDFARLARELSEDPATAEQGGDLGFFPRGRMLPSFEEVAFSLGPGEVSEPVETPRGVHVIRIEERREAVERTLTDVSMEIARELLRVDRGRDRARAAADGMAAAIAGGRSFEAAARDADLRLESSGDFGWADVSVPGLGPSPEVRAVAFTLSTERPASSRVFALAEGFALVSLLERDSPAREEIEADLERVREREEQALRARLLSVWYEGRREALAREGKLRLYPLYPQG